MKKNELVVNILKEHGLLVGSRAWAPTQAEKDSSDYDYVIPYKLYKYLVPFMETMVIDDKKLTEEYDKATGDLRTKNMMYLEYEDDLFVEVYNVMVIDDDDLDNYLNMNTIILSKIEQEATFKKAMRDREVRKLMMQSLLRALRSNV